MVFKLFIVVLAQVSLPIFRACLTVVFVLKYSPNGQKILFTLKIYLSVVQYNRIFPNVVTFKFLIVSDLIFYMS